MQKIPFVLAVLFLSTISLAATCGITTPADGYGIYVDPQVCSIAVNVTFDVELPEIADNCTVEIWKGLEESPYVSYIWNETDCDLDQVPTEFTAPCETEAEPLGDYTLIATLYLNDGENYTTQDAESDFELLRLGYEETYVTTDFVGMTIDWIGNFFVSFATNGGTIGQVFIVSMIIGTLAVVSVLAGSMMKSRR